MILLFISLLFASNSGSEGWFINESTTSLICLRDVDGCLEAVVIPQGRSCQADAVYFNGTVFKIPNHSTYVCDDESCGPSGLGSWLVMQYGKNIKRGPEHYEQMELYEFLDLMGNKEFCL